ncbi:hypothetical protein [Desulfogranum marinum]|uniref:hypothetical protein n=1 Tax=Desulfogranum marinum TaxID=453220 RepID=UPI0019653C52|nr:hypothetical protein [Desulfogranum marinum]MBM9512271.1 hypothetical protein [Desulfogranum marinum]
MSSFPNSPNLLKGGIVIMEPDSGKVIRIISLQYNPDTLTRTFQVQSYSEGTDRAEALRLKSSPVETIKLEAEIDATDQLEFPDQHQNIVDNGIHGQLAALETLLYPTSEALQNNHEQAGRGVLEIVPMEAPLSLFVWSKHRAVPVRITEFSITEEAFDTSLNPLRAKINLGFRVLSVNDLGFKHRGGSLFMSYLKNKEALAGTVGSATLNSLGLEGL